MDQNVKSRNINFLDLFNVIRKNIVAIFGWAVTGGILATIIVFIFVTPKYSATLDILVNQKDNKMQDQYTVQQADLQSVNTYKDILQKPIILNDVVKVAKETNNYDGSVESLKKSMTINSEVNSKIISVTVKGTNAYVVADLANLIGKVFTKKIKSVMDVNNVTIVSKAKPDLKPVFPNKKLGILIGAIFGGLIGIVILIVKEIFDTTVKGTEFLTDELNLTNLGYVLHIENKENDFNVVKVVADNKNQTHRRV